MVTTSILKAQVLETRTIVSPPQQGYNHGSQIEVKKRRMSQVDMQRVPLFAGLNEAQITEIVRDFSRRQYRQGESIFLQGDPGQSLYLVESGQVRIYVQDRDGQETSVILCGPGDLFGELALIDGLPRSASAVVMENTVLLTLDHDRFREQMRRYPQMALNLMKALSVLVRYNTQQFENLTLLDIPRRLARKLIELAEDHGEMQAEGVYITLALNQSDLASLIGTTRESVNKAMSAFRREGLIRTEQNHILLLAPDVLRERSE